MNEKNKETLYRGLYALHKLGFEKEDIIITGSLALDMQGLLPSDRIAHDADFIVKASDHTWKMLKCMEAMSKEAKNLESYPDGDDMVILKLKNIMSENVVLNIWRLNDKNAPSTVLKNENGVGVAPAGEILKAKKSYGRNKDLQDIASICKEIL